MPAPRIIQKRFSGHMTPSARIASGDYVSLWDITDSDTIIDGQGWHMPKAFATAEGVKQWREFLESLSWGLWDPVTVWAEVRGFKPGDALRIERFNLEWCGYWKDFWAYQDCYPNARREDFIVHRSHALFYSILIFKKAGYL